MDTPLAARRAQELNPAKLPGLFRKQLELCNVKKGETVAVVSDPSTRREYVLSTFAAAAELGADAYELCVSSANGSFERAGPPTIGKCKGTLEALKEADLIVIFYPPLFSDWLKTVMKNGVRVQQIIDAPDDLAQLQSPPGLKEAVLHAHELYSKAKNIRVTSEAGTDFSYTIGDFPIMS